MCDTNSCETLEWLKERIHNKKHFSARLLGQLSEVSGMETELVAKGLAGVLGALLVFSDQAHFFANAILVVVPILLIFVFPAEKPTDESLFVYFSLFGAITVLDRSLERIPFYYILKLALFALLYAPPYILHNKISSMIKEQLKAQKNSENLSEMSKTAKSSPKTAPANSTMTAVSTAPKPPADAPADPEPKPAGNLPSPSKSCTDIAGGSRRMKDGINPMESSSFHNLRSEADGFHSGLVSPGSNLNDLLFNPRGKLVFNAPFDYDNLTYHMKLTNNSHHRIAYAVKGNAVPRVMANPAFGIMNPKEERLIAVSVQKFAFNDIDYNKDRIAFDYVLLPDSNKAKEFSLSMFQHADTKRRKNIIIEYNP